MSATACSCVWGVDLTSGDGPALVRKVADPDCIAPHEDEPRETKWSAVIEENLRVIKHEMETPMRGHDEDGWCCRRARLGAEDEPR